jgi:hypothetical protein
MTPDDIGIHPFTPEHNHSLNISQNSQIRNISQQINQN